MNALTIVLLLAVVFLGVTMMVLLSIVISRKDQLPAARVKGKGNGNYHYLTQAHLMTPAEEGVFHVLVQLCESQCHVVPQVGLSYLLNHKIRGQNWDAASKQLTGKVVDFVLLERESLRPICAIELDDASHNTADRQTSAQEIERIFAGTKFPLVRITQSMAASREKLGEAIMAVVNEKPKK